ncbi:hypothetical protein BCL90_0228 [Pedobacter alluvionis]|uniref:Uncharacterized protein n=1 Tax=Pedobacter alluvionis TaxID=475253 RepID=A0A497Y8K6_9SPHI|nr:hypothetical protein BCL90_0228 [Pedobacter alluvionis]
MVKHKATLSFSGTTSLCWLLTGKIRQTEQQYPEMQANRYQSIRNETDANRLRPYILFDHRVGYLPMYLII